METVTLSKAQVPPLFLTVVRCDDSHFGRGDDLLEKALGVPMMGVDDRTQHRVGSLVLGRRESVVRGHPRLNSLAYLEVVRASSVAFNVQLNDPARLLRQDRVDRLRLQACILASISTSDQKQPNVVRWLSASVRFADGDIWDLCVTAHCPHNMQGAPHLWDAECKQTADWLTGTIQSTLVVQSNTPSGHLFAQAPAGLIPEEVGRRLSGTITKKQSDLDIVFRRGGEGRHAQIFV